MVDGLFINFRSILVSLSSLVSGTNNKQNNSGDREFPWKIPQFILILSDFIDPLVWFRNKLVFHIFIQFLGKFMMIR